jgi:predicted amidohydrolase YtcJ
LSPEQAISVRQALRAQTATAQWVGFQERKLGTLEAGKLADVTVLAADPFTHAPSDYRNLPISLTVAGGKVTHGSLERAATGVAR